MINKLHLIFPLFSTIIIGFISFSRQESLQEMSIKMIITIVCFYVIGLIAQHFIVKTSSKDKMDISLNSKSTHTQQDDEKE